MDTGPYLAKSLANLSDLEKQHGDPILKLWQPMKQVLYKRLDLSEPVLTAMSQTRSHKAVLDL